ncbi:3-hydroxybutyryl-CoA dehydratase [Arthrobacter crystallopoietes BAB-32]|uniref:enoyl-CoA hydratase n=1 Tax=Arthrobacter crystallopoietes BAB-32 TaxID=1246476 RepID=N1VAU9_9MICC|nr:enoyl-CoA hydratase-related protein [Arthrobacter crystallopoietes]EMY35433.1 3-hydroxybutyryl-CoA dehydratase [Arthrobacter crystallopoietes BAB-32]
MDEYQALKIERADQLATVTIDRPEALNALSTQVVAELARAVDELRSPEAAGIRCVLLTGSGAKAFAAGADIREMADMTEEQAAEYSGAMQDVTRELEQLPVPVIACVNGFALGGGLELAMACDFIYATASARFGQPEVGLGLIPGFGGTVRLPQLVGPARAKELIYSGRAIDAATALQIGLVNQVFDTREEMLEAAAATGAEIAAKSPAAVASAKGTIDAAAALPTAEGLLLEREAFAATFGTEDARIGTRAFLAKEKPQFIGK